MLPHVADASLAELQLLHLDTHQQSGDGITSCRSMGGVLQGHGKGLCSHQHQAQVCIPLMCSIMRVQTSLWVAEPDSCFENAAYPGVPDTI